MTDTTPDPLVERWSQHMAEENIPKNTVQSRLRSLRTVITPSTATREDIEAWWRSRSGLAPATRANDLSNVRQFYRWANLYEHRADDPTARIRQPKVPNGVPRPILRNDLRTVLHHLAEVPDLRRAVCLGTYGGLRVSEAAALHWHDVDLEARRMRILGKGQKTRLVAMSPMLVDELHPDTGHNVVTGTYTAYSANNLQRRANRAIAAAGVSATFHQLRHRYGTLAYQATGDLLAVGRQMGHSSPATTAMYAAESEEVADRIALAVSRL